MSVFRIVKKYFSDLAAVTAMAAVLLVAIPIVILAGLMGKVDVIDDQIFIWNDRLKGVSHK